MRLLGAIVVASFLFTARLDAQTEYRNRGFSIANENDVYLLLSYDRYYSNGIFLDYRFSPYLKTGDTASTKRVYRFGLMHRFWTPQDVTIVNSEHYWRPYAGMLNLNFRSAEFYGLNQRFEYGLDLGVIGKISGAQAFQEGYHKVFGFPNPQGWDTQISNGLIIDLKLEYNRQFIVRPGKIDMISSTQASLGNGFTNARQRIDFRFGKLQNLRHSAFFNALIGEGSDQVVTHTYFFLGYGLEVVGHNTTIQGHVFGDDSPLTFGVIPWIRHLRIGFATNSETSTLKFTYNWLSKEVKDSQAGRHAYIGFELDIRLQPAKPKL